MKSIITIFDRVLIFYMRITATGADFSKNLKVKRSLSYENVSIKKIVEIVASRHNLEVSSDFDDIYVVHLEQTNESDLHFLKRLAQEDNAIFSIKNNTVIFKKKIKNNKKSKDLPRFSLDEDECENVSIENTNKTLYNSCKAIWRDTKENIQKSITVGSGEPIKVIKDSYENVAQAKLKARAALEKANAGLKSGSIACYGFEIYAGGILDLTGTYDDETILPYGVSGFTVYGYPRETINETDAGFLSSISLKILSSSITINSASDRTLLI